VRDSLAILNEYVSNPEFPRRGFGLLITGHSRDARSEIANAVLGHFAEGGGSFLSMSSPEVVAAANSGQMRWLCRIALLVINDLDVVSEAELDAMGIIQPLFNVTRTLEGILDGRHRNGVPTLITTRHERPALSRIFSQRLASLIGAVGFSIKIAGDGGATDVDSC
jgi:hypothetical protein